LLITENKVIKKIYAGVENNSSTWVVYRLSSLGDVTLLSGVLDYWLRTQNRHFVVITRPQYAELFKNHPAVDEVVGIAGQNLRPGAIVPCFKKIAARFSGLGFMDLHVTMRSRLLGLLWQGQVRRYPKFSIQRRIFVHTHSQTLSRQLCAVNIPQRYALAMEEVAPAAQLLAPKIYLTAEERADAQKRLREIFGVAAARRPVVLHPYATHSHKEWPARHWQKLIALLDKEKLPWLIVGQGKAGFLPETVGDKRNLSDATSLRELCSILEQSSLLVTGDSGPMHLASAVGLPLLAFFGPTTREWGFYPAGENARVLELALPCRPCSLHGLSSGKDCLCIQGITPEMVFKEIFDIMLKI
jgi:ADP-heptose:LPS heptosyltransferase